MFRYIAIEESAQILWDAAKLKMGTEDEQLAKEIFCYYCEQHHLDKERVGKPEGALTKQYDSSCNDL